VWIVEPFYVPFFCLVVSFWYSHPRSLPRTKEVRERRKNARWTQIKSERGKSIPLASYKSHSDGLWGHCWQEEEEAEEGKAYRHHNSITFAFVFWPFLLSLSSNRSLESFSGCIYIL